MKWRRKGQVRGKKISAESTRGEVSTSNTLLLRLGKFEEMFVGVGKKKKRMRWRWESVKDNLDLFILRERWAH